MGTKREAKKKPGEIWAQRRIIIANFPMGCVSFCCFCLILPWLDSSLWNFPRRPPKRSSQTVWRRREQGARGCMQLHSSRSNSQAIFISSKIQSHCCTYPRNVKCSKRKQERKKFPKISPHTMCCCSISPSHEHEKKRMHSGARNEETNPRKSFVYLIIFQFVEIKHTTNERERERAKKNQQNRRSQRWIDELNGARRRLAGGKISYSCCIIETTKHELCTRFSRSVGEERASENRRKTESPRHWIDVARERRAKIEWKSGKKSPRTADGLTSDRHQEIQFKVLRHHSIWH